MGHQPTLGQQTLFKDFVRVCGPTLARNTLFKCFCPMFIIIPSFDSQPTSSHVDPTFFLHGLGVGGVGAFPSNGTVFFKILPPRHVWGPANIRWFPRVTRITCPHVPHKFDIPIFPPTSFRAHMIYLSSQEHFLDNEIGEAMLILQRFSVRQVPQLASPRFYPAQWHSVSSSTSISIANEYSLLRKWNEVVVWQCESDLVPL